MTKDMTEGRIIPQLTEFTIPLVLGNLFQLTYNAADSVIVGKFVGDDALAAVGTAGPIMNMVILFISGMCMGAGILMSTHYGAKKYDLLERQISTSMLGGLGFSAAVAVLLILFAHPLLELLQVPADIIGDAKLYLRIIFVGLIFTFVYNFFSNTLRALGDSKAPLYFLIISAFLNIVLDLVFIIVFHMGAAGAAVATVISQGVSGALCLVYIVKKVPLLHMTREDWKLSGALLGTQIRIGIPMALQYSITAVGTMMVQASLNILGSTLVAAYTAAGKIEQIVTQAYVAMGTTMATYGAQNMGAGNISRIRQGFKASTVIGVVYAVVSAALVMTVGKYMTYLFVSEDVALIMDSVNTYLVCAGIFFIPLAIVNIYRNGIQGLGYGLLPMMAGVAELAGRGVVAVIAARQKSYLGVCLASPAAWVLAALLLIGMYYYVVKIDLKKIFPDRYAGNQIQSD